MGKNSTKEQEKQLSRKQHSRMARERRIERAILWSSVVVVAAVVAVLGYGYFSERILKARQPVAVVNEVAVSTGDFQARVRLNRISIRERLFNLQQQQAQLDPTDSANDFLLQYNQDRVRELQTQLDPENAVAIGGQTLSQLVAEELVRQEAQRLGLDVSPEDVQRQIELYFGYDRAATEPSLTGLIDSSAGITQTESATSTLAEAEIPPSEPITAADFSSNYAQYVDNVLGRFRVPEDQFRLSFEAPLLAERVREAFASDLPDEAEQVKVRLLIIPEEDLAAELDARLEEGEDFQVLVQEFTDDEDPGTYGTELDWLPREQLARQLGEELAEVAFTLEVGSRSPITAAEDDSSYYLIEVEDRATRDLDELVRSQMASGVYETWLESQMEDVEYLSYADRVPVEP